jgi:hypothetical protein
LSLLKPLWEKPEAAFRFLNHLICITETEKPSSTNASTLFSLHVVVLFVASLQHKSAFVAHFFADQGSFWCNRPNFPKGGWPGSLEELQMRKYSAILLPEPYV